MATNRTAMIATCRAWPEGNADLCQLARLLHAELRPWQDIAPEQAAKMLVLPLGAWDYSENPDQYRAWLQALVEHDAQVLNAVDLQLWNMDKRYLLQLGLTEGMALLPHENWAQALAGCGWDNPVIKPLIGQSGRGVRRLHEGVPTPADYPQGILLQPFIDAPFGEVCLFYIQGEFSHAAHRKPQAGEWRANSAYGVEILPVQPRASWLQCAQDALARLPEKALYARVDGLIDVHGDFRINEIELIEPALYATLDEGALPRLAAAIRAC